MAFSVYRFYSDAGRVLYVGRSSQLPIRIKHHFKHKPWWTEATRIELEHFETRAEMVDREKELIATLYPLYNVALKAGAPPPRPAAVYEPFHSLDDAADHYSVTVETVRDWAEQGLPRWRIAGNVCVRFSETDAWLSGEPVDRSLAA
jgi:hypothetical protein